MKNYNEKRNKQVYEAVSIIKLLSILFCGIIFFSTYGIENAIDVFINNSIDPLTICIIVISILILIYKAWTLSNLDTKGNRLSKRRIIETAIFIVAFLSLILISGSHASKYKIIFLFIIITSTIEFGKLYGVVVATISSFLILAIDLKFTTNDLINSYFEADLVLSGIFILTAWLLGNYVSIEEKYRDHMTNIANKDELTNMYNHRFFQQAISNEIENSNNSNKPVSLLFIDIDHFKDYNDLYGHLPGDKILIEIANLIKKNVRDKDIPARYGGDEFAVILPDTNEDIALSIGEKIRNEIDTTYFEGEENLPNKNLTVSIGISCFPNKAKNKVELINSSADALYRAKFFNKNRVEVYHSILGELQKDIEEEHIDIISSIKTLMSVINAKDRYTYGHTERVVIYCDLIANKLELSQKDKKILKYGAYLHDIGKIETPKEVLNKKMRLTEEEWNCIKRHPEDGTNIIRSVPYLENVIPLILHHHERYDGKGYPLGLEKENIPYLTRIITVADSFDAMTSNRPYKTRMTYEEAMIELEKCKSLQFDPHIVDEFIKVLKNTESIYF